MTNKTGIELIEENLAQINSSSEISKPQWQEDDIYNLFLNQLI